MTENSVLRGAAAAVWSDFCAVCPSPEARDRMNEELQRLRDASPMARQFVPSGEPRMRGFNDNVFFPPEMFTAGTPSGVLRKAAAERAPLRGAVRVVAVLVDFPDKKMAASKEHFEKLFFSEGELPHGSVRDYFREVSHGLVDIVGEIIGPVRLPHELSWYANGNFGIGKPTGEPRAQLMARDAAITADPLVNYAPYDNDGNGFVDAFMVIHPGSGGEATLDPGDIWSHKWVLPNTFHADGANIFAYLTIPEDAKIGVCAHELGHLLFGLPDLYDADGSSEGVGNWCLMGGGSWGGKGDIPTHPSAWCKLQQGWVDQVDVTEDGSLTLPNVQVSHQVHRVWTDGLPGKEYFLLENRQQMGYDVSLPNHGLLVWQIDEGQPDNTAEPHYLVGLVQADDKHDLEWGRNRGDAGDPYPGTSANTSFTPTSRPSSVSYDGVPTEVSITDISECRTLITASVSVSAAPALQAPGVPVGARARETEIGLPGLARNLDDLRQRLADLERTVRRYPWENVEAYLRESAYSAPAGSEPADAKGGAMPGRMSRFDAPRGY
ncbi:M6 family metalloprotease domain-containing protein [Streptomyces sp. M2CJ-2]|uniref:M6 family metalloprotease domain-containing protein n=1 Tax=Streptomyces sp. M2CJ-2 TaxID=2803948 RepID=UPI0019253D9C|nr:M6 family metalloprotease domain-containing protein [Streptomyces sp. M2CJ-2]MBL3670092.1 M6 family metalloprotease domain-containing protein [Streptomyces sp. M2CJ-2]